MSRIDEMNQEIQWSSTGPIPKQNKEHQDYTTNLDYSVKLCSSLQKELPNGEVESKLPNGMKVKISDSEHLQKALMVISWCPGRYVKKGNYATPIFLHQYSSNFKKTTENVINFYVKSIMDHDRANPTQLEFLPVSQKV